MVGMEVEVDTYSFGPIPIYGLCIPSNIRDILWRVMEETVVKTEALGRRVKTFILMYPWELLSKIRRQMQYFLRLLSLNKNLYCWKEEKADWAIGILSLPPTKLQGMHSQEYQGMN